MNEIKFVDEQGHISLIPIDKDLLEDIPLQKKLLAKMKLGRAFEKKANELFAAGFIHGTLHLGIGQEAASIGSTMALHSNDKILTTHRGHLEAIGKGMSIESMYAELLGRENGVSKGYGGSMHMIDPSIGVMHANGIVAANTPLACGIALSLKKHKKNGIVNSYIVYGGMNEGSYSESLNLASLWGLPVVFTTINNTYGMSTPIEGSHANPDLSMRGMAFSIPTIDVDGNQVLAVYQAMQMARNLASNNKPVILILNTYRICGQSRSDKNCYRSDNEIKAWQKRCPIAMLEKTLLEKGIIDQIELQNLESDIQKQIQIAVEAAQISDLAKDIQ